MKIIPAIDIMAGQVVRLYLGDPAQKTVYSDDPASVAKTWAAQGADMLHVVDLDATLGLGSNTDVVKKIASAVGIPVEVAGGLRNTDIIQEAASVADRVVIGTLAFEAPDILHDIADSLDRSRIVISADHRGGLVVTRGWQQDTKTGVIDAIRGFAHEGFSEFLLTDTGRDGTMRGPDLEFLRQACMIPGANVIASGGISGLEDVQAVHSCNAWGVILGKALYEDRLSIPGAKSC